MSQKYERRYRKHSRDARPPRVAPEVLQQAENLPRQNLRSNPEDSVCSISKKNAVHFVLRRNEGQMTQNIRNMNLQKIKIPESPPGLSCGKRRHWGKDNSRKEPTLSTICLRDPPLDVQGKEAANSPQTSIELLGAVQNKKIMGQQCTRRGMQRRESGSPSRSCNFAF